MDVTLPIQGEPQVDLHPKCPIFNWLAVAEQNAKDALHEVVQANQKQQQLHDEICIELRNLGRFQSNAPILFPSEEVVQSVQQMFPREHIPPPIDHSNPRTLNHPQVRREIRRWQWLLSAARDHLNRLYLRDGSNPAAVRDARKCSLQAASELGHWKCSRRL
jgi:hypothetical protein